MMRKCFPAPILILLFCFAISCDSTNKRAETKVKKDGTAQDTIKSQDSTGVGEDLPTSKTTYTPDTAEKFLAEWFKGSNKKLIITRYSDGLHVIGMYKKDNTPWFEEFDFDAKYKNGKLHFKHPEVGTIEITLIDNDTKVLVGKQVYTKGNP
jgi:hypothetical protein